MCNVPKLRFKEHKDIWVTSQLGTLVDPKRKITYGIVQPGEFVTHGVPLVRGGDYSYGWLSLNEIKRVTEEVDRPYQRSKLKAGDILLTIVGHNTGNVAVVPRWLEGANITQTTARVAVNLERNSAGFIEQALRSHVGVGQVRKYIKGAAQPGLNLSDIEKFELALPSFPEQQKIAAFLTAVDTKIEQLTQKEVLLKQYKKGVMQKIFSQEIRFKADDGSEFPEWKAFRLSDFLVSENREVPKPDFEYLALGLRSHCKGTFQKPNSDPSKIAMDKLFKVETNDLVVNITFAWEGAIAIAKPEDDGGLVSHRFPCFTFDNSITDHHFFQYVITHKRFRQYLDLISPGGAGRNRVMSKKDFVKLKWNLPCLEEQKRISCFFSSLDQKIYQTSQQLEAAKTFKKGLLQQMFV